MSAAVDFYSSLMAGEAGRALEDGSSSPAVPAAAKGDAGRRPAAVLSASRDGTRSVRTDTLLFPLAADAVLMLRVGEPQRHVKGA